MVFHLLYAMLLAQRFLNSSGALYILHTHFEAASHQ
jgi:hypothetical protein